jgi:ribosome recycling factor
MTTIGTTKEAAAAAKTRMDKAVDDFRKEIATLRTGRANASLLDSIRVDYHGTPMPVNQLGTLTTPDPTMIVIAPWDPGVVALIDKAIRTPRHQRSHRQARERQKNQPGRTEAIPGRTG